METINNSSSWLSFTPMNMITTNHDLAIRRFCPAARIEHTLTNEIEQPYSPCDQYHVTTTTTNTSPPHLDLAASEVDELVDSFINVDDDDDDRYQEQKQEEEDNNKLLQGCASVENHPNFFHHFQDDDMFFIDDVLVDDVDVPINVQVLDDDQLEIGDEEEEEEANNNTGIRIAAADGLPTNVDHGECQIENQDQGLLLVHLLLACAEAVGCRDTQLADSILAQTWASVNPWGDSLHRVSYCFAMGLKSRLSLLHHVNADGTFTNGGAAASLVSREEKLEAFRLFYQTTPYVAFGFLAANEAICQAARGKHSLHVIDLGMDHTLQWPSLIRALGSRPGGPPMLRITGLINDQHNRLELEASMRALTEDATSFGILLEFNMISESVTPALFTREKLGLREGEALFVNSIMHLHKFVKESRGSLKAVLQAIKKLGPTLLTVVEQDANHNGPFFLGRFLESLHYYSAIFDSLEASLPRNSLQRVKIEKLHLAEEIRNIVAYEGTDRIERHERADQWRRQLGRAGFQVMGLKCMSQARMMLSVYGCDGYTLASEKGCLHLGWKGRPIMLASAWQVHNVSSS